MKKQIVSAVVLAVAAFTGASAMAQSQAKEGPWMVRVRAVNLHSANKDGTDLAANLSINNKTIPEVDISYFFTKNIAAELILTVPQGHTVYSNGTDIGSLKHLPPTLTAQYHFEADGFKPYVGAGVNYTRFSNVNVLGGAVTTKATSWGLALQAGVDIPVAKNLYLNIDVKKVNLGTDIYAGGVNHGSFKVDPTLLGVGLGWRF
jgi:outer membrane protein